jgi:hypothetical protein
MPQSRNWRCGRNVGKRRSAEIQRLKTGWVSLGPLLGSRRRPGEAPGIGARRAATRSSRCLVPEFDGALSMQEWKDALWAKFFTGAPARQRQSVEQYKIVKRA